MYTKITTFSDPKVIGVTNGVYQLVLDLGDLPVKIEKLLYSTLDDFLSNQDSFDFQGLNYTFHGRLLKKAIIARK